MVKILYLHSPTTRSPRWNGEPLYEASKAELQETLNGDFYTTIHYPITDSGIYTQLTEEKLISASVPLLGRQLFRIKKRVEEDNEVVLTCYHISEDIFKRYIRPVSVVRSGCQTVLNAMLSQAKSDLGDFTFTSDITSHHTYNTTEDITLYAMLMDGAHSIVGTWEGELVRDNLNISIKKSRGEDRGAVLTSHQNLERYQREGDGTSIYTRITGTSTFRHEGNETDTVITATVESPLINQYPFINEASYINNDIRTVEEMKTWLRAKFTHGNIDKLSEKLIVKAYELDGQTIHIGDIVSVKSWKHHIDVKRKVVGYTYDQLSERYLEFVFDDKVEAGALAQSGLSQAAATVIDAMTNNPQNIRLETLVKNANAAYDAKADKLREEVEDGIEATKAKVEEKAAEIADILRPEIAAAKAEVTNDLAKAKEDLTALGNTALAKASDAQRVVEEAKSQLASFYNQLESDLEEVYKEIDRVDGLRADATLYAAENRSRLDKQAKDILAQAQAQAELISRTETVEQTLDGQRTTITELGKGLDSATGQIQSVGNRTKTVEDGLSSLRSSYKQLSSVVNPLTGKVQSVEQRTADLQSGINGIREDFSRLSDTVGRFESKTAQYERDATGIRERLTSVEQNSVKNLSGNMLVKSAEGWRQGQVDITLGDKLEAGKTYTVAIKADRASYTPHFWTATKYSEYTSVPLKYDQVLGAYTATFTAPRVNEAGDSVIATIDGTARTEYVTLVQGKLPLVPWAPHWSEIKAQLAEYTAEYKRTAQGMTERLTALEVYKDGEIERADKYFERAKEETAKQRSEFWKAVQDGYVANATYTEDVRGIRHQYNEIRTLATGAQSTANEAKNAASTADRKAVTVTQNLADYKADVDQQLTRLQQNQRDIDGRVTSLDASMRLVPGQITAAVSAVEGKIPTNISHRNLATGSSDKWSSFVNIPNSNNHRYIMAKVSTGDSTGIYANSKVNLFVYISVDDVVLDSTISNPRILLQGPVYNKSTGAEVWGVANPIHTKWSTPLKTGNNYHLIKVTGIATAELVNTYGQFGLELRIDGAKSGKVHHRALTITTGDIAPNYWVQPIEDLITDITSMQTTVTQTADGVRQLSTKVTTAEGNITTAQADIRRLNDVISNRLSETAINDIKNQVRNVESLYEQTTKSFTQRLTDVTAKLPKGYSGNMLVNSGKGWNNLTQIDYILAEPIVKGQTYTIAARYWRQSGVTEPASISFWLVADHTTERINQNVTMTYDREVDAWVATFTADGNAPAGKTIILTMTRGSASWATLAKGNLAISPWSPSAKDVTEQIDAKASEIRQEIGRITASVQSLSGEVLRKAALTISDDGIVLKAGKTPGDVAKAIASYFKLTPEAVSIITPLIKVSGDMIVNGAITAAKLDVGSVATAILTADAITSKHIKADRALVEKIISAEGYFDTLFSKSAFITKLQAIDLTATQIKGGVMRAINNAMAINLNQGNIEFYTSNAALRRVLAGYPNQFVKFETGTSNGKPVGVTVIGSNRGGNENSNDGSFVGLRLWNGEDDDHAEIVADEFRLVNNAFTDPAGWRLNTLAGRLSMEPIKDSDRASSKLAAGDLWLYKNNREYVSVKGEITAIWSNINSKTDQTYSNQLMEISNNQSADISDIKGVINLIIDNLNLLHKNKDGRAYNYTMPNKL